MNDGHGPSAILDASALLAFVHDERSAGRVETAMRRGTLISTINWAEVLSDLAEQGEQVSASAPRVSSMVAAVGSLTIVPFDDEQAVEVARLRILTKSLGLSLADRACLGLGRLRRLPVLTTDRAWRSLHLPIRIEVIR